MAARSEGTTSPHPTRRATGVRGRPRDAGRDIAIIEATRALLIEVGYDRLSVESVATRAGVGKATIYRRYADKAALVADAVDQAVGDGPPGFPGDLRESLVAVVTWLAQQIEHQQAGLLGAMFAGMRDDPDLARTMRRVLRRDEAAMTDAAFAAATERGERLRPDAAQLFVEIAPAVVVHRTLIAGEPCDTAFVEHVVDDILLPLVVESPSTLLRRRR